MNPIKRKMASFLTKAARSRIEALDKQSSSARQFSEIEDVENALVEEIEKLCRTATMAEITRALFLVKRLKKAAAEEKEAIMSELNQMAENLVTKVEAESGRLRLPRTYHHLVWEIMLKELT